MQANPRKGGVFNQVPAEHDVTDEMAPTSWPMKPSRRFAFLQGQQADQEREGAGINQAAMEKVKGSRLGKSSRRTSTS